MDAYYEPAYEPDSIPFEDHLKDYLRENWPVFEKNGYHGVIFLFDEFHTIADDSDDENYVLGDFVGAINELQNDEIRYHLVLTGLPRLSLNLKRARSYSERMFTSMVIDNLSAEDARSAISRPLEKTRYTFDDSLIQNIIKDTGQYPYFIQFYCKEIIDMVGKKNMGVSDYNRVKPVIVKQLHSSFFDARVDALSPKEAGILYAMAKIDSADLQFGDIVSASGVRKSSLSRHLKTLERHGMIYNHRHGTYRFSLPMLRDYLLHKNG